MSIAEEAAGFAEGVLTDHAAHAIGTGRGYTFAHSQVQAESFMLAGSGPAAWAWFVYDEDGEVDHAYFEYCTWDERALVPIPSHLWGTLLKALKDDDESQLPHG